MELSNDLLKYTPREIEVARLMAEGLSSKMIADRLGIALKTVKAHRWKLFRKAEGGNAVEVVLKLKAKGLI